MAGCNFATLGGDEQSLLQRAQEGSFKLLERAALSELRDTRSQCRPAERTVNERGNDFENVYLRFVWQINPRNVPVG
jgi:hypothetical protein